LSELESLSDKFSSILKSGEQLNMNSAFPRSGWNVKSEASSCCFNLWLQRNSNGSGLIRIHGSMSNEVRTLLIKIAINRLSYGFIVSCSKIHQSPSLVNIHFVNSPKKD
jgi:hypothetical protein